MRIADLADPDRFNPLLSTMDLTEHLSALVYSTLVIADDRGRLIGDLATDVPSLANGGVSRDGKTVVYHLRSGVTWHDGQRFTSRDVAFTWRQVMNPRNNVFHREGYEDVARVDTPNDLTVVVHLKRRSPPFVTRFFTSLQEGAKVILPEHLLRGQATINESPFNAAPVGTGPFRFVRWDRGRGIEFAAYDRYFRGRPKIDRIRYVVVPDSNTILNETRSGEIDLPQVATNLYTLYERIPGVVANLSPWNAENVIPLNSARPGLRHVEVRQAIARAIDYQAIIEKVTHGVGEIARDIIPPNAIGYVANPPYPYDPAGARRLLEAHGWKLGADGIRSKGNERLDFVFYVSTGSSNASAIAVQVQAWLRAIGIGITVKTSPYNQIFAYDGPIQTGRYDMANYSYTLPWDPDNLIYLGCDKFPYRGENTFRYCDPIVDAGERRGLTTDDPKERAAIYAPVERRIRETVPYIPLYLLRRPVAHKAALTHFSSAPSITEWWNAWEWEL
ncbi:MAG: peptide ABC transporter substrate-binding protein [Candidatus Eremiobacteraeota bacterium]|nr:peptide ABC transporter substrate-binding protein [Candidatus Eremiobacteraeota bacterium]